MSFSLCKSAPYAAVMAAAIAGVLLTAVPASATTSSGGGCGGPYEYANNQVTLSPCIQWDGSTIAETGGGSWTLPYKTATANIYLEKKPSGGSWTQVAKLSVPPYSSAPYALGYYGAGVYRIEMYLYLDGVKYGEDAYTPVLTLS